LPHHDQKSSDDQNQTEHGQMLSSYMLLLNLILLIEVTFSTPTPGFVNPSASSKRPKHDFHLLLQLRVVGFGLLQDGDVRVGVFPEREEILVGGERPDAGGVGIRSLRSSRLQGVGTSHAQMRQRSRPAVPDNTAVVDNLLKLGDGIALRAFSTSQIRCERYSIIEAL
jgi:hypothetical protein